MVAKEKRPISRNGEGRVAARGKKTWGKMGVKQGDGQVRKKIPR